jgi:hypothetical protein
MISLTNEAIFTPYEIEIMSKIFLVITGTLEVVNAYFYIQHLPISKLWQIN